MKIFRGKIFKRHQAAIMLLAVLLVAGCGKIERDRSGFSVILLPDTQRYCEYDLDGFQRQTEWIRSHHEEMNLKFVIHLGDIVERDLHVHEWNIAERALSVLDGVVPYSVLPGNHDKHSGMTEAFNARFGPQRFDPYAWYGGHRGDTNDNNYCFFSAAGMDFMIVSLEFGPTDDVLEWANDIVRRHPSRRVIVATHSYLYHDDTLHGSDESQDYLPKVAEANTGVQIWEKFVRHHANIFLVVGGHVKADGTGRHLREGLAGNAVHEILANYQEEPNGGNGWLRILRFLPEEHCIRVTAYSPVLDTYRDEEDHTFDLEYSMD